MKKGSMFQVNNIEYVIALCEKTKNGNAAVLLRRADGCKCMTVSNLKTDEKGKFSWERGYTAGSYADAVSDFMSRIAI